MKRFFQRKVSRALAVMVAVCCLMGIGVSFAAESGSVYPLETNVKLTYWNEMNPNASAHYANLGDTPFAKEWQARTGVEVEFIHSTTDDSFTLLMASGDIPDIIEYWWSAYPGGVTQALTDEVVVPLSDLMDDYAPNFKRWMEEHPVIAQQIRRDDGSYIGFPAVNGDGSRVMVSQGLEVRADLLAQLGLAVPETIDEWYEVLKGFKSLGLEAPFTDSDSSGYLGGAFSRAYGVVLNDDGGWYVDDGKVLLGAMQPAFKDFMTLWRQWYAEGLIDRDIATNDTSTRRAKMLDSTAGAVVDYWSGLALFNTTGPENTEGFEVVPAPLPVLEKGDVNLYSMVNNPYEPGDVLTCITNGPNKEIAAQFMDYLWGEEGNTLANWGVEGETFTVSETGEKHYTDFVLKNPDGWIPQHVKGGYMRSYSSGPYVQDSLAPTETFTTAQQHMTLETWTSTAVLDHLLPPIQRTPEEDEEFARIMADVKTHFQESAQKFLLGTMSLDNFDTYLEQLKSLNVERAVEIQQAAYDRYMAK